MVALVAKLVGATWLALVPGTLVDNCVLQQAGAHITVSRTSEIVETVSSMTHALLENATAIATVAQRPTA